MSSVDPSPLPPGIEGASAKVYDWNSFVADYRTSKVYSVASGGHGGYSGNEVDVLDLEREDPTWSQVLAPSSIVRDAEYYADGRPASRHSYYGVTLDDFDDLIMLFSGSRWEVGFMTRKIDSYNIGTNRYSPQGTHPDTAPNFIGVQATAVNPSTGDVYLNQDRLLGRWNRATNTFQTLSPSGSSQPVGYKTAAAFDTSRDRILFVGGAASDHHLYTLSSNAWSAITFIGADASAAYAAEQAALVYVPSMDRFLLRTGDSGGGTVYQINPSTFEVTTLPTTGGAAVSSTANGPFNKFLYVPRLRGAVYVPSYSGNAWFLRLH
jgi:hypothetical protein